MEQYNINRARFFCNCSYLDCSCWPGLPVGRPMEENQHESKVATLSSRDHLPQLCDGYIYNTRYSIPWSECGPLIEKSHLLYWMSRRLHMFAKILGNTMRHCRNSCGGISDMRRLGGTLFPCGCCHLPCIWCSSVIDSSKNKVVEP